MICLPAWVSETLALTDDFMAIKCIDLNIKA